MARNTRPIARLTGRGLRRLRNGHPWIYRSDIQVNPEAESGALVAVAGPKGRAVGVATWSTTSLIAIRRLPIRLDEEVEAGWWRLVEAAVARRPADRVAGRLIYGDADGLPGVIVDRYGDALSVQSLTAAAAQREPELARWLCERFSPSIVVARNDPRVRVLEGLPQGRQVLARAGAPVEAPLLSPEDEAHAPVEVPIGDVVMGFDLLSGQKTGAFLDQVENWQRAGAIARERGFTEALDCFCYEGGFSLQLARAGCSVESVDASGGAIARVKANAERNGLSDRINAVEANAFEHLRALEASGRKFDLVVLDPPAFAKRRDAVESGLRAYKEINLRGFKLLKPGGVLITCSCSALATRSKFAEVISKAAADAGVWARWIEGRGPGADHPALITAPETDYLKVMILEV